jgi:hypothetical protein
MLLQDEPLLLFYRRVVGFLAYLRDIFRGRGNELPTRQLMQYLNPDGTRNTEFDTRSNLCPNPGTAGGKL